MRDRKRQLGLLVFHPFGEHFFHQEFASHVPGQIERTRGIEPLIDAMEFGLLVDHTGGDPSKLRELDLRRSIVGKTGFIVRAEQAQFVPPNIADDGIGRVVLRAPREDTGARE